MQLFNYGYYCIYSNLMCLCILMGFIAFLDLEIYQSILLFFKFLFCLIRMVPSSFKLLNSLAQSILKTNKLIVIKQSKCLMNIIE